jgi:hypothetical protein
MLFRRRVVDGYGDPEVARKHEGPLGQRHILRLDPFLQLLQIDASVVLVRAARGVLDLGEHHQFAFSTPFRQVRSVHLYFYLHHVALEDGKLRARHMRCPPDARLGAARQPFVERHFGEDRIGRASLSGRQGSPRESSDRQRRCSDHGHASV